MISLTIFMSGVAGLMLCVVVLQIMLRGPMPVARRLLFERVMMSGLLPVLAVCWLVRGVLATIEGEMLWTAVSAVLVFSMAGQALMLWRKTPAADGTRT